MITVVIPMYNSRNTIIPALESVRKQTTADEILEVIVVNDGSKDDSVQVVESYIAGHSDIQGKIKIINKVNGGVSSARNAGMKAAAGDYIAFLDSDDEWVAEKIQMQMNILRAHPEIDFLGCNSDSRVLRVLFKKIDRLYRANIKDICIKNFPHLSTAIFKKQIFDTIGGFDENQKYAEDGNFCLNICSKYNFYHYPVQVIVLGGGKPTFGSSGLSANLKGMHLGNVKNIKELEEKSLISVPFYAFLRIFFWIKYIRRIAITKIRTFK